jgi:hypothetical protein
MEWEDGSLDLPIYPEVKTTGADKMGLVFRLGSRREVEITLYSRLAFSRAREVPPHHVRDFQRLLSVVSSSSSLSRSCVVSFADIHTRLGTAHRRAQAVLDLKS